MKIPWFRRDFLRRRQLDRLFLDLPDTAIRAVTGRRHLPPYSLRAYVGGAQGFDEAAHRFLAELRRLRLFACGIRLLDIGCGCGRVAYGMATAPDLREFALTYVGMDIDRASVNWCQRNITPLNSAFTFYHADIRNTSYNPHAPMNADAYRFPHPDSSFDLILLSSVFTHMLENELRHYFQEIARLLAPGGVAHASFFLYQSAEELSAGIPRHGIRFLIQGRGHYAVNRQDHPANAVAYHEEFVRGVAQQAGLSIIDPTLYGGQDVLLFVKRMNLSLKETLGEGWYEEEEDENGHWRWTKRTFVVHVKQPRSGASQLWFRFRLPEALIQEIGRVCLKAVIAGVPLREREYSTPGEHIYAERLLETPREDIVTVRFELDKCYGPKPNDLRELGVQVAFHSLCGVTLRELSAIHLTP